MSDLEKYMIETGFVEVEPGEFYFKPKKVTVLDTTVNMSAMVLTKIPDVPQMFLFDEDDSFIRSIQDLDRELVKRHLV